MTRTFKIRTNASKRASDFNSTASPSSITARTLAAAQAFCLVQISAFAAMGRGVLLSLLVLVTAAAQAAEPVSRSRLGGVAIGGQDTVAYHTLQRAPQAAAVQGSKRYTVEYKGAKWRFASAESAEKFKVNPEAFHPAYNGFCANALSLGNGLVRTDGSVWEIFGQQLYLFYAKSGRERWVDADTIDAFKEAADAAWAEFSR